MIMTTVGVGVDVVFIAFYFLQSNNSTDFLRVFYKLTAFLLLSIFT